MMKRFLSTWIMVVAMIASTVRPVMAQSQTASLSSTTCPGAGCISVDVGGQGSLGVQVAGTFVGTLQFEARVGNSSTWASWSVVPNGFTSAVTSTTTTGLWVGSVNGFSQIRVRFSAYTSGTAVIYTQGAQARISTGSSGGAGSPGGPVNSVQFNATTFDGVPLNATADKQYLQQVSSGPPSFAQVASADLSDAANLALLNAANVFTSVTGQEVKKLKIDGSSSGSVTLAVPAAAGSNTLTWPAGTTDFSATGGSNQVVKQNSAGGAFTVGTLASTNLSDTAAIGYVAGKLSQFAATSSAELAGVLSDETGSGGGGLAVFNQSPVIVTPTIASFANANHNHTNSAGGGTLAETALAFTDVTTGNCSSTKHGFTPKSGADATTFLNGAATCAFAQVKDSDLATTDITTNDATSSKHGFMPKLSGNAYDFALGNGTFSNTVARGTITTSSPWTFTQTWNAVGVTFTGLDMNITRTASADASYYLRIRNNTGDVFALRQWNASNSEGACVQLNEGLAASSLNAGWWVGTGRYINFASTCSVGTVPIRSNTIDVTTNTSVNPSIQITPATGGSLRLGSDVPLQFSGTSGDATAAKDAGVARSAAGIVEINNGTIGTIRDFKIRHQLAGGTAPTAGACGTSPGTPTGGDLAGRIAVGSSPSSTCVVTFGTTYTTPPNCFAVNKTTSGGTIVATETTSAVTFTQYALATGLALSYTNADVLAWHCPAY